jgi:hypothetical protein
MLAFLHIQVRFIKDFTTGRNKDFTGGAAGIT